MKRIMILMLAAGLVACAPTPSSNNSSSSGGSAVSQTTVRPSSSIQVPLFPGFCDLADYQQAGQASGQQLINILQNQLASEELLSVQIRCGLPTGAESAPIFAVIGIDHPNPNLTPKPDLPQFVAHVDERLKKFDKTTLLAMFNSRRKIPLGQDAQYLGADPYAAYMLVTARAMPSKHISEYESYSGKDETIKR